MKINIKSLTIENFRSIKKVNIDFYNNKSGVENEIKRGLFKLSPDKKHAIPAYYAIMARNSIGKTSILESMSLIADINNGNIGNIIIQNVLNSEMPNSFNLSNPLNATLQNMNDTVKKREEILNSIKSGKGEWFHLYQSESIEFYKRYYKNYSNDKKNPILIKLSLFVDEETVNVKVVIDDSGNLSFIISTQTEIQMIVMEYLSRIGISSNRYPEKNFTMIVKDIRRNLESVEHINFSLVRLIKLFGKEKTINILKLADNRITGIVDLKQNGNIRIDAINLNNASKIPLIDLSTGTRQYIVMMNHIISQKFNKKNNGLVLIDEIELSLHNELINSLKIAMQILFQDNNIQFIFTTHSPLAVANFTSKKQIISLDEEDGIIISKKMSSLLKPQHNIINAYESGILSPNSDEELTRNIMVDLFYE